MGFKHILEALAVGDAMGMPTEFMTQKDIDRIYPGIRGLLDPQKSYTHPTLPFAAVTDDTEQNLYLIRAYLAAGEITVDNSAAALSRWVKECDAVAKKYIGPSSAKALEAIENGVSPLEAGRGGTTCGGIMRTPALVLCSGNSSREKLLEDIRRGCIPTHHTSQAIEAAAGYGFALRAAMEGKGLEQVLDEAMLGTEMALQSMDYVAAAPSCGCRLRYLRRHLPTDAQALREELYDNFGTGLPSIDIFGAVFALLMFCGKDVFGGICLAASLGGDTDTIAALYGALAAAYAGGHNIPGDVISSVAAENHLELDTLSREIERTFWN